MDTGIEGNRKRKKDGINESNGKKVCVNIVSSRRVSAFLAQDFHKIALQQNPEQKKKDCKLLTAPAQQFSHQRVKQQLEKFQNDRLIVRSKNVVQKKVGMKITPLLRGELNYFKSSRSQLTLQQKTSTL
jgi:predicted Holliday junction resolvase-like endonuclease